MDLTKAFDTINHKLLLAKLSTYGFSKSALTLVFSYLSERWQRTWINTAFSTWIEVLQGVPQGSVLGPLLFNIYINDLFWFNEKTEIANLADDNTYFACDKKLEDVVQRLEYDALIAIEWFDNNYMKLNAEKCNLLIGGNKSRTEHIFVKVGDAMIWGSQSEKLLGLVIDNKLKFDAHISNLCKTANRKISVLARMARYLDRGKMKILMNAYITSQFSYSPLTWMFHTREINHRINKVHERALRIVYGDYSLPFNDLLEMDNSCTIHQRNVQSLAIELFKCKIGTAPPILANIFPQTSKGFILPAAKSTFMGLQSLQYFGCQV